MKLTPRLKALASLVPLNKAAADIGTDHGYLAAYLVRHNLCPYVIAGDKNEKPLGKARDSVRALKLEGKVLIRLGDGLEVIQESDQVKVIIIAGMGGKTICSILDDGWEKLKGVDILILQPMVDIWLVRCWLIERGFRIKEEKLAKEGDQIYEIIKAGPGEQGPLDDLQLELGPKLLEKRDPLIRPYLLRKLRKCKKVMESFKKSKQEIDPKKYNYWNRLTCKIEEELRCLQEK